MNASRWTLKSILNSIGWRLVDKNKYRVIKRSPFEDELEKLLKKKDFFFVQVGGNDGVRFDGLYSQVTKVNANGVVIEPLPRYFKRLQMNYEDYPGVKTLNAALHPTSRSVEIFHVDMDKIGQAPPWAGGIGSLIKDHHQKSKISDECMTSTTAKAITFEELIAEYSITHIDLLQIDVEGFDYELLKMIPFDLLKPLLIKYEWVNLSTTDRESATQLLHKHGYRTEIDAEDAIAILL